MNQKNTIFLFIFFFTLFSYSLSNQWKLSRSYGDIRIYISPNQTRLTVSMNQDLSKEFKIQKDMIEKTAKTKRQMLSMMGMEDWEISSRGITIEKEKAKLFIQGSYIDSKNRKVYFVEHHDYTSNKSLQMLLTHFDPLVLKQDSEETALNPIRREYGF